MNLRELNYFVAIGETQSITKAAARLRVAQPALTRHLRHLEAEVGARLAERHGRGIVLTDAGQKFLSRIRPLLNELRQATAEVVEAGGRRPFDAAFGIPSSLASLADRLIECAKGHEPSCRLRVVDGWSAFIVDWLRSGQLDLGIVYDHNCDDPAIELVPIADEEHFLVGPADHPALAEGRIALAEVARLPLILPSRSHALRIAADAHFRSIGCVVSPVVELDAMPTIRKLVEQGRGLTLLSQSEVVFNRSPLLATARVTGPSFFRTLFLARRSALADEGRWSSLFLSLQREMHAIVRSGLWGSPVSATARH